MSLFALIVALVLELLKPIGSRKHLSGRLSGYVEYFQINFNSGLYSHGKTAWWLAVLPVTAGAVMLFLGLHYLHPFFAWLFNVLALYLSLGFGRYSHRFGGIQKALGNSRPDEARAILSELRGPYSNEMSDEEVARLTIETSLIASLHHLFGVIVWFVLFSLLGAGGAAGALLYCLVLVLGANWADQFNVEEFGEAKFNEYAREMAVRLNWLPVRLTAATFAIVGNFEDTVYCWRSQSALWSDAETGILLAGAAGASGIRLGLPVTQEGIRLERPELGVGDKSGEAAMRCTVRLIWRSVLFMLFVLLMLTLAGLLG